MLLEPREQLADPGIIAVYGFVGLIGARLESATALMYSAVVIAVIALLAWMLSLRRLLMMSGTPTSRIGSAAQGYVELCGQGRSLPEFKVLSRLTGLPCLWYRYKVEQRDHNNKWEVVDQGRSQESFVIDDGSGQCLVDPDYAEVITRNRDRWMRDNYRYTEWLLLPHDEVYVLGQFSTLGGATAQLDLKGDVVQLLSEWKRDQRRLLERFDLDKDGQISEKEWELARLQAKREVLKAHNEIRTQPGVNMVHKPKDGRLFLISNIDPNKLLRRYKLWSWLHLAMLLGAVATAAALSLQ